MMLLIIGLIVSAVPWSDSPDFFLDTSLHSFELGFAESPDFPIDTFLTHEPVDFAESPAFALDTTGLNRVWGDSEPLGYENPLGCVGEYVGTYNGAFSGTVEGYLDCDNTLSFTFISYLGPVQFQSVATVHPDGTVSGSYSGATMSGTFDFTDCTASGAWVYSGYSGTWNLVRSAPGPCFAPSPDEQPQPDIDLQPNNKITLDHLWQWDPGAGRFVDPGPVGVTIDPNLPTYLITHGWDGSLDGRTCGDVTEDSDGDGLLACGDIDNDHKSPDFAMSSVGAAIYHIVGDTINLVAWDWADQANTDHACTYKVALTQLQIELARCDLKPGIPRIACVVVAIARALDSFLADAAGSAGHVQEQGTALSDAIRKYMDVHGSFGSELHLIGKSHGGGVLGAAAQALNQKGLPPTSLTTLDTPNIGTINTLQYVEPNAVTDRVVVFHYDLLHGGFGTDLLPANERLTNIWLNGSYSHGLAHLWIAGDDNCTCQPEGADWALNECPDGDGWFPTGVITPGVPTFDGYGIVTSLLDVPSFPAGCFTENGSQFLFVERSCETPAAAAMGGHGEIVGLSLLRYEPFQSAATWFGNLTQLVIGADPADVTNRVILMQEQGDASFFKDIDWPSDAVVITFDYMFREPRGEENLTVYVDNEIVYYDNAATTLARDHLTFSGAIYVGNVAGRTARLNFVLRTDQPEGGEFGGELVIDNIRAYGFLEHDADLDGDRDLFDFAAFQRCFGHGLTPDDPLPDECWAFDVDGVDGVGVSDYAGDTADPPQFRGFVQFIGDANVGGPKVVTPP